MLEIKSNCNQVTTHKIHIQTVRNDSYHTACKNKSASKPHHRSIRPCHTAISRTLPLCEKNAFHLVM